MKTKQLSRKTFISRVISIIGGSFLFNLSGSILKIFPAYAARRADSKIAVVTGSEISKKEIEKMVNKAFQEFGGVKKFIKKGMKVVIKPNIAWNSPPERAHNTNPYLVETVARLCKKAGAKVTIFDRTCNSARLSYKNSGIKAAAKKAGAKCEYIDSRKFIDVKVPNGLRQETLSVYKPIVDADFVINMPIAKHHSIANLTISMKNLMGVLGGNRGGLHHDMHENIVDFTKAIKVDLVICDALRILTRRGPSSGTPDDVKETKTIIMGTNQVTVDAYATTLFGISPSDIKYIALASKEKMGEIEPKRMKIRRITA